MEKQKIEIVKKLAHDYNQFEDSLLQPAIQAATGQPIHVARKLGRSHCNMLSWFFGLYADERVRMNYSEFLRKAINIGACNDSGYTLITKNKIAPAYGFTQNIDYIRDWDYVLNASLLDENYFYQLKKKNSDHYMISWVENGELMIADTHDRGYGVPVLSHGRIDEDHFAFLLKIGV